MRRYIFIIILLFCSLSHAGTIERFKIYSTGDSLTATNLNGNLDNAYNVINGSLDNNNANVDGGFRFIEILDALPAAGNQGRVVYYTATDTLYFDSGTSLLAVAMLANSQTFTGDNTFTGTDTFAEVDINSGTVNGLTSLGMSTGTDITEFSIDDTLGGDSDDAVPTEQAVKAYVDDLAGQGNVIFAWSGTDVAASGDFGLIKTAGSAGGLTPDVSTSDPGYVFFGQEVDAYSTALNFRFKKIAAISTVTIEARIWSAVTDGGGDCFVKVDIGGANNEVTSTSDSSPTWQTPADIDVSGLSDGTTYDGIIQMKAETNNEDVYMSAITLIAN